MAFRFGRWVGVCLVLAAAWAGAETSCSPCGPEDASPEARAALAAAGHDPDACLVLLEWRETAPKFPETTLLGVHARAIAPGSEPFDVYVDQERRVVDADTLAFLGVTPKNWNQRPDETFSETPAPFAQAPKAQVVSKGPAAGVSHQNTVFPPLDLSPVYDEDAKSLASGAKAPRIGVFRDLDPVLSVQGSQASLGAWTALTDGGWLWTAGITSPAAVGIRVHFATLSLPAGAVVTVHNATDPSEVYGPYTVLRNAERGLWSATCFSPEVVVECYVPAGADREAVRLTVDRIVHIYVDFASLPWAKAEKAAGSCNLDVACYPAWASAALGVGGIGTIGFTGSLWCTGSLLVDKDPSTNTPYFMTAYHCVGNASEADSMEVYWFYQRSTCGGSTPNPASVPRSSSGADFLAGTSLTSGSDFALTRLREMPPAGVTYLGWTTTVPALQTAVTCIHHPDGDYKRISFGAVDSMDSNRFYIQWAQGTTEPGSSGSPLLLTSTQQFVGQLHGGYASCSSPLSLDDYGRFDVTYPLVQSYLGSTAQQPISIYPTSVNVDSGTGTITVNVLNAASWSVAVTQGESWLTYTPPATGATSLMLTYGQNIFSQGRTGLVVFSAAGSQATLTVTQEAYSSTPVRCNPAAGTLGSGSDFGSGPGGLAVLAVLIAVLPRLALRTRPRR